ISRARCATSFDDAHTGTTPCSYSTCRSLILPMAGNARFRNMNTLASTPNERMPKRGTRPHTIDAAEGSIVVNAPVADVYERWLAFEDYPKFIKVIKRVRKLDENHFAATLAFNGKQYNATLEIMLRVPERRLAWRTLATHGAADNFATGVVCFATPSDQSTCVTLKLTS